MALSTVDLKQILPMLLSYVLVIFVDLFRFVWFLFVVVVVVWLLFVVVRRSVSSLRAASDRDAGRQ